MSEQKWTKEPWTGNSWIITRGPSRSGDGMNILAKFEFPDTDANPAEERHHNCVRAVTCVNALAGIPDPSAYVSRVATMEEALKFYADPANMERFDVRKPGICKVAKSALEVGGCNGK